jgi:hypothetical protein
LKEATIVRRFLILILPSIVTLPLAAQVAGVVANFGGPVPMHPQTNSPISLVMEHKTVQTLPDGTHVTRTSRETFYRDSLGRTRTENEVTPPAFVTVPSIHSIFVMDPVAGTQFSWLQGGQGMRQVYTRMSMPTRASLGVTRPVLPPAPQRGMDAPAQPMQMGRLRPTTKHEDLGMQTVQGESCQATRDTTVYPEGMMGNDRPITQISETCMSREVGRSLQDRYDDPRTGVRTSTMQSLSRAEPDMSLFQPPAGYTENSTTLGEGSGRP